MRFLADENVPRALVEALKTGGRHDVEWVRTAAPGAPDETVLAMAATDERVLLTFDKDFGELAASRKSIGACGIVLVRVPLRPGTGFIPALAAAIDARTDWAGHFSVVEPGRIRMRPLRARS